MDRMKINKRKLSRKGKEPSGGLSTQNQDMPSPCEQLQSFQEDPGSWN